MGTLIRYEMKKIFSPRFVAPCALLLIALVLYSHQWIIRGAMNGYMEAMRSVYGRYEGRVLTGALREEIRAALAEHREHVSTGANWEYGGAGFALQQLADLPTTEELGGLTASAQVNLERGYDENGNALSSSEREYLARVLTYGYAAPVVHYVEGWKQMSLDLISGTPLLLLLAAALPPLFTRERSARMESVFLSSSRRLRAAAAKLLAASAFALGAAAVSFGLEAAVAACTYGLDGASLPVSSLLTYFIADDARSIGAVYALAAAALLAASAASAAVIALSSACCRHPAAALAGTGALLGAQFLLWRIGVYAQQYVNNTPRDPILGKIFYYLQYLPAKALSDPASIFGNADHSAGAASVIGFSVLLSGAAVWISLRRWLRPRTA